MAKPKTFVLSDDSVNSYGFRVLTEGIDISQFEKNPVMLYMHARSAYKPTGDEVIGRWENIRKEGGKLLADAVIDEGNEFSAKIAAKVDGGFLKMASIGFNFDGCKISEDAEDMVAGQTGPTILKCKLKEASIVDIGANDSALRLYDTSGQAINLSEGLSSLTPSNNSNIMKELKAIALALGLKEDASAAECVAAAQKLQSERDGATAKLADYEKDRKAAQAQEAADLITKGKELGVLSDNTKASFEKLFKADHDSAKATLSDLIYQKEKSVAGRREGAATVVKQLNSGAAPVDTEDKDFGWYQKNEPAKLAAMKSEQPGDFLKLFNDHYGTNFTSVDEIK